MKSLLMIKKIVSGGQTGADRAALDWAIENNIPHGGWCPKGRLAEDGAIDAKYQLQETSTSENAERTEKNVINSDATVIFSIASELASGSLLTAQLAQKHQKPMLHLSKANAENHAARLTEFIRHYQIETLNIAGPRASDEPEVYAFVIAVLDVIKNQAESLR